MILKLDKGRCMEPHLCPCPMHLLGDNWLLRIMGDGYIRISDKNVVENAEDLCEAIRVCPNDALSLEEE